MLERVRLRASQANPSQANPSPSLSPSPNPNPNPNPNPKLKPEPEPEPEPSPNPHPHPDQVFEWGNETNPGAALYVGEEGLSEGGELTIYSDDQFNGQLLLHSGHVWDETRASAPEVRLSAGELGVGSRQVGSRDAGAEARSAEITSPEMPPEMRRAELLAARNLSHVMDFSLQSDALPAGLLPWLRLALATPAQVGAATGPDAFDAPLSAASERLAVETLHVTLDRTLAEYDFDVDEDEQLLEARTCACTCTCTCTCAYVYRCIGGVDGRAGARSYGAHMACECTCTCTCTYMCMHMCMCTCTCCHASFESM